MNRQFRFPAGRKRTRFPPPLDVLASWQAMREVLLRFLAQGFL